MYSNWRNHNYQDNMNNQNKIKVQVPYPSINIDETNQSSIVKKPKGWGHWNSFTKSEEYGKLIPGKDEITEEELSKHNKPGDLWIGLMYEKRVCVFDVTLFSEYHPGGYDIIKSVAGRDATEDFRLAHAYVNPNMISRFKKGYLVRTSFKSPNTLSPGASMLAPVRKPKPTNKPKWNWTELDDILTLTFDLHKTLIQKDNCVTIQCEDNHNFKLRIFFDVEYYYFEIKLHDYLAVLLDTLDCDINGRYVSISFRSTLGHPASNLGGVIEDTIVSLTNSVDKEEFLPCNIVKTQDLNNDCREFIIEWPRWARIGIPLAHHVIVQCVIEGDVVQRPYTPTCEITPSYDNIGSTKSFTLMIKRYTNGQLSSFMHSLEEDSQILVSLPTGTFKSPYWIDNNLPNTKSPLYNNIKSIIFLAGGSGITPMIRLMLSCLSTGTLNCHLLFFNRTQRDQIYMNEFEELTRFHNDKFQVTYILSQPASGWTGYHGRISNSLCKEILGNQFTNRFYMICGPLSFNNSAMEIFRSLNVEDQQIFEFKG